MDVTPRSFPHTGHYYDLAIVGAGLAGCELAYRAALAGLDVLLVSQSLDSLGNLFQPTVSLELLEAFPAGGLFALAVSETHRLSFTGANDGLLDTWSLHRAVKHRLEATPGIHLLQSLIVGLSSDTEQVSPQVKLETWEGISRLAQKVVLAVGSFLQGRLHIGSSEEQAGRLSEVAYDDLYLNLCAQGVVFEPRADEAPSEAGSLPYRVQYQTLAPSELEGFRIKRLPQTYALGRCTSGEHSYLSVLEDAATLGAMILGSSLNLESQHDL
jgi:tRNA U34 5-carboxymethylaminomethyl modifying enzyme MnmG/GidA